MPAIDPAISTLPVMNQLIANVSNVPNVRQLMALTTDLVCVSAPRNKITGCASLPDGHQPYHACAFLPSQGKRRRYSRWSAAVMVTEHGFKSAAALI